MAIVPPHLYEALARQAEKEFGVPPIAPETEHGYDPAPRTTPWRASPGRALVTRALTEYGPTTASYPPGATTSTEARSTR